MDPVRVNEGQQHVSYAQCARRHARTHPPPTPPSSPRTSDCAHAPALACKGTHSCAHHQPTPPRNRLAHMPHTGTRPHLCALELLFRCSCCCAVRLWCGTTGARAAAVLLLPLRVLLKPRMRPSCELLRTRAALTCPPSSSTPLAFPSPIVPSMLLSVGLRAPQLLLSCFDKRRPGRAAAPPAATQGAAPKGAPAAPLPAGGLKWSQAHTGGGGGGRLGSGRDGRRYKHATKWHVADHAKRHMMKSPPCAVAVVNRASSLRQLTWAGRA